MLCLPPEWAATGKYQAESGAVWSLGVLLFEMLTRKLPCDDAFEAENANLEIPRSVPRSKLLKLIQNVLISDFDLFL